MRGEGLAIEDMVFILEAEHTAQEEVYSLFLIGTWISSSGTPLRWVHLVPRGHREP